VVVVAVEAAFAFAVEVMAEVVADIVVAM